MNLGAPAGAAVSAKPPADDFGTVMKRIGDSGIGDQLLAMSAGLLSGRGAAGWAAGIQGMQKAGALTAQTQLAQAKAAREQAAQNVTAQVIAKRLGVSLEQGLAMAQNQEFVKNFLATQYGAQDGRVRNADGSMAVVPGSAQDPSSIKAAADAGRESIAEAGVRAGVIARAQDEAKSEDPYTLSPGQTRYDPETNAPVASVAPKEAPPIHSITRADGSKVDRQWDPATRTWVDPDMGANPPTAVTNSDVPPGVDPGTYRKELAKATVAEQKGATQRAQQAGGAMSILDRAEQAYGRLAQNGGIGPYQASGFNRAIGGAMGRQNEIDRQEYEAATKDLELLKAQISMKGQGAISDSERKLLGFTMGRLDAASPETGLTTLRAMRQQFQKSIDAPGLSTRPNPLQPDGGQPGGSAPQAPGRIIQLRSADEYAAAPSGTRFIAPDGKLRVKP